MRTKTVTVAGKTVIVNEKKISELKALGANYKDEIDQITKANNFDDISKLAGELIYARLPELFPVLKPEDIDDAYPSELEELVGAFVDVNFTGIKKIGMPLLQVILQGLKKQ